VKEPFDVANSTFVSTTANQIDDAPNSTLPLAVGPAAYSPTIDVPAPMPGAMDTALPTHIRTGRDYMLIDEWGPYDFRSPVLWPRSRRSDPVQTFELLGPPGEWRIKGADGAESFSRASGTHQAGGAPDLIEVTRASGATVNMVIELEFTGDAVTDRFGQRIPAGEPFTTRYEHFYLPINWDVSFFAWDDSTDPREAFPAFRQLIQGPPLMMESTTDLAYQWYRAPGPALPQDRFATVADGTFQIPEGDYIIDITSDDGVRLWLDGELIHDDWTYHAPRQEMIPVRLGGSHMMRAEHFEIDGYSTLMVAVRPAASGTGAATLQP
jgi:PA14 domain